jgi:2,3,4,5-tetrahydropyridine-2-carboxylate N-succinyltransferase
MQEIQQIIEDAWEVRTTLQPSTAPAKIGEAVSIVLDQLDEGKLRVAEKIDGDWITHQWIKKAVLLSFRLEDNKVIDGGPMRYYDKVQTKFANYDAEKFARSGIRVVPPGSVVVSGNLPSTDGRYSLYCADIVKKVDAQTRAKTSINDLLRGD